MSDYESDESNHDNEPWAYIYLSPLKVGDKEKNKIVLASCIRDFDYDKYCDTPSFYKNKPLKYKPGLGIRSRECVVYCAKETKANLEDYIQSREEKGKRFPKPKLQEHLSFSSSTDVSLGDGEQQDLDLSLPDGEQPESPRTKKQQAKRDAKIQKAAKEQARKKVNSDIVEKYINSAKRSRLDDDVVNQDVFPSPKGRPDEPTLSSNQINELQSSHAAATRAYKMQIQDLKNVVADLKEENQQLKMSLEQRQDAEDGENDYIPGDENASLAEYDKVFHRDFILKNSEHAKEEKEGDKDIVILRKGVKCNQKTYMDAFTQKKPGQFVILLSTGIYGKEDLANRCRRKQADTGNKEPLDETITQVINEEFYHFLRIKRFTLQQIEDELNKCSNYHRNAITSSVSSKKHHEKKKAALEAVDAAVRQLEEQNQTNPLNNQQDNGQETPEAERVENNETE